MYNYRKCKPKMIPKIKPLGKTPHIHFPEQPCFITTRITTPLKVTTEVNETPVILPLAQLNQSKYPEKLSKNIIYITYLESVKL